MKNSKISVIIPVYNAEEYLNNILDDLLAQTYQNMEIILVNDGSKDNSLSIMDCYQEQDKRVKVFSIENSGPSSARNYGLKMSTGEYVRFIDADDRLPIDSMEKMLVPFMENEDVDLVIGNFVTVPDRGYFSGEELQEQKVDENQFSDLFVEHMKTFFFGVPWNKLYKKNIIMMNNIKFAEDMFWCEDLLFNIEYYKKCKMIYILNTCQGIYQYIVCEKGITSNLKRWNKVELQRIEQLRYEKVREYFEEHNKLSVFELEWKNAELYERLSTLTKYYKQISFAERYKTFKQLLQEENTYKYICIKWEQSGYFAWKVLKCAIETKKIYFAFIFFSIKGLLMKYMKPIAFMLRKRMKPILPKRL